MKNNIKSTYEKNENADGSVDISYLGYTEGIVGMFVKLSLATMVFLVPFSIIIFCVVIWAIIEPKKADDLFYGVLFTGMCVGYWYFCYMCIAKWRKEIKIIKIIPNVGIEFEGTSIPFKELDSFVTIDHQQNQTSSLCCETRGARVAIVSGLDKPLVAAIERELIRYSGNKFDK